MIFEINRAHFKKYGCFLNHILPVVQWTNSNMGSVVTAILLLPDVTTFFEPSLLLLLLLFE